MGLDPTAFLLSLASAAVGALVVWVLLRRAKPLEQRLVTQTIAERVRTVGRLVALEVSAKEIATATKGWSWMPPLLLSQARVAMIFHFENQYSVDLRRITRDDVVDLGEGRFRVSMPPIESDLRLKDVIPYDIQDGRVLGLLDVIQVNARTQKGLMDEAQKQAAHLIQANEGRYFAEARASAERQLRALLDLFDVELQIEWPEPDAERPVPQLHVAPDSGLAAVR